MTIKVTVHVEEDEAGALQLTIKDQEVIEFLLGGNVDLETVPATITANVTKFDIDFDNINVVYTAPSSEVKVQ